MEQRKTSWGKVAGRYNKQVGTRGHYFHENVLLPAIEKLIGSLKVTSLLDLGCGQGVLERTLPASVSAYVGIDISSELISQAKKQTKHKEAQFFVGDATQPITELTRKYDVTVSMLALQNMENYRGFFANVGKYTRNGGYVVLAINHPYYRVPRSSGWEVLPGNGKQIRWVSNYLTEQKIPIVMDPLTPKKYQKITWSFHVPLSVYVEELAKYGFAVTAIQELASPKESEGKFAKRENTARQEIPLFMIVVAKKVS